MLLLLLSLALLLLIASCQDGVELEQAPSALVVEGWIERGSFPVVQVSHTLPISTQTQQMKDMTDYIIKWAKVTVSDGEKEVILTGVYDEKYFPPYIYTTSNLRGVAGRTYTLTVDYRDYHASAVTTIPEHTPHCEYRIAPCADNDTLYEIYATLAEMDDTEGQYYQFFACTDAISRQYQPCPGASVEGAAYTASSEICLHRGQRWDTYPYNPYFSTSEHVSLKCALMDETSYLFWKNYTQNMALSRLMFAAPNSDLPTNIIGGYGYWCGYNAEKRKE